LVKKAKKPTRKQKRAEKLAELVRLDLGCGQNKKEGFLGVDAEKAPGVDVVHDLRVHPWPWADSSVDEIYSSHFLEHLDGPERIALMNEVYRVLKPGATAQFIVPYYSSQRAFQDPTHKFPPICERQFLYFNQAQREAMKIDHYGAYKCDFDFNYGYVISHPDWISRADETRNYGILHYNNVVDDLIVTLTKKTA
jgi:SAM-dependent methyltransferase